MKGTRDTPSKTQLFKHSVGLIAIPRQQNGIKNITSVLNRYKNKIV